MVKRMCRVVLPRWMSILMDDPEIVYVLIREKGQAYLSMCDLESIPKEETSE